ncbi:hypothetical protein CONPUDRAFT_128865 [Coniophora puteana RWD-64-598 SS2]|uniref:DUF4243 domain-containing protein n=1 Tax=Coniophora puteana (strain RWD-64-598) TaxID=741705 RepID=A0A5M3MF64_CONPW|nr:uncharacterized protein CONPUDRAFT_128865 [Coniophora puteana RWD-64-598 SS2]EIW77878.1 hypothetical protein CONPUDRAFT_128865 [Coniophora puteana RWD-64-598 SS2]
MSPTLSTQDVGALFPAPAPPPSVLAPRRIPNSGPECTAALVKTLKHNHEKHHVFFNERSFHNHAAHHLICIWALGASGPLIESAYNDTHVDHMKDQFKPPQEITDTNFVEHLGDENYYTGYLNYFHDLVLRKSASELLEEYIFSEKYNIDPAREAKGEKQPEMLNRFVEIIMHPLIHTGYGVEFGLPGMLAEGFAQTSIHPAGATTLVSQLLFRSQPLDRPKVHPFSILAKMLKDPRFEDRILDKHEYAEMLESRGDIIVEYGAQWVVDIQNEQDYEFYLEQLIWTVTMIYGIGSWSEKEPYAADFFTMHAVTSALFLPSVCAKVSHRSQSLLLRAHFLTSITWWLVRGRPSFPIERFNALTPTYPKLPGPHPTPAADAIPSLSSPYAVVPNAWMPILQSTLVHPNEHLCKLQRALAHFAELYGHRPAGYFAGAGLDQVEKLDGSMFVRVAILTGDLLGWSREGEPNAGMWDWQEFERAAIESERLGAEQEAEKECLEADKA